MSDLDDLRLFDDVGEHGHKLLRDQGATSSSGSHMHVWLTPTMLKVGEREIPEGSLIISAYDGAHEHDLADGGLSMVEGGVHRHAVRLPGFRTAGTSKDGEHGHMVLVHKTGFGAPHSHELSVGGVTLKSLMVEDFVRLFAVSDAAEAAEDAVETAAKHHLVSDPGCVHATQAEKDACAAAQLLKRLTNRVVYGGPHNEGVPIVTKSIPVPGVNDKMLGALSKLVDE